MWAGGAQHQTFCIRSGFEAVGRRRPEPLTSFRLEQIEAGVAFGPVRRELAGCCRHDVVRVDGFLPEVAGEAVLSRLRTT